MSSSNSTFFPAAPWVLVVACNWFIVAVVTVAGSLVAACQSMVYLLPGLSLGTRLEITQALANAWWILFPFTIEVYGGVSVFWYGDRIKGGTGMIIGNHRSNLDFSVGALIASRAPSLGGCGRLVPLMKNVLKYAPAVGWVCYLSGAVFLRRRWQEDKSKLTATVDDMVTHYPRPFWLGLYPEGTRFDEKKRDEAQEFARKRNAESRSKSSRSNNSSSSSSSSDDAPALMLPILENTLLPRKKAFVFFAQHRRLRNCMEHLHDFTIGCDGGDLLLRPFLRGTIRTKSLHIHTRQIAFDSLPKESRELEKWLYDCFIEKDRRLTYLNKHGRYPVEDKYQNSTGQKRHRCLCLCAAFSIWSMIWLFMCSTFAHWSVTSVNLFLFVVVLAHSLRNALKPTPNVPRERREGKKTH